VNSTFPTKRWICLLAIAWSWVSPCPAEDTNTVSTVLRLYGGFEQAKLEGWQPTDPRVEARITTEQPREGKQAVEIRFDSEKPVYYSPGVTIQTRWQWDCNKPAHLRFSVNARQRYLGYNLYALLEGTSDKGEPFTFYFLALQQGDRWELCKESKRVWHPADEFAKGISGFEGLKRSPQTFCAWMPGLAAGPWSADENAWIDFDGSLQEAFTVEAAPPRPGRIVFETLTIRGYIANTTHYWLDAISLGEK
jgi:hypothetical protein